MEDQDKKNELLLRHLAFKQFDCQKASAEFRKEVAPSSCCCHWPWDHHHMAGVGGVNPQFTFLQEAGHTRDELLSWDLFTLCYSLVLLVA